MTSKILIYYSLKGNTYGIIDGLNFDGWDVIDLKKNTEFNLQKYDIILIGTSTYGRGSPPLPFYKIKDQLMALRNKRIGLFGSGRKEYEFYCGALDVLEELLSSNNKILFKYKFEGYPKEHEKESFKQLLEGIYA